MNKKLEEFARNSLKYSLSCCSRAEQKLFKQMYSHGDLGQTINAVVDNMEVEKLDWAMTQVENTLSKKKTE